MPPQPERSAAPALRQSLLRDAAVTADQIHSHLRPVGRDGGFQAAVGLYEQGRWLDAFRQLGDLADHGHAGAAKLALLMLRYGAALYGTQLRAEAQQIARWAALVIEVGKLGSPGLRRACPQ